MTLSPMKTSTFQPIQQIRDRPSNAVTEINVDAIIQADKHCHLLGTGSTNSCCFHREISSVAVWPIR